MQLPSVDIFIGLVFLVGIAYGFVLKRDKTITTLCSVYIGMVIASSFAETVFRFFNGNTAIANQVWIKSNASLPTISIIIFLICIFFISGSINSSSSRGGDVSPMETILFSAFTMALILSTIITFLAPETRAHYLEISKSAKILYDYRTVVIVAAPLMIVVMNFRR